MIMEKCVNSYERLSNIITILLSEEYLDLNDRPTLTINKIAELTDIPEVVIREDIRQLLSTDFFRSIFVFDGIESGAEDKAEAFFQMLKERSLEASDVKIGVIPEYFYLENTMDAYAVMLSPIEKNIFAKYRHRSGISEAVWIKDTIFSPTERELKNRDDIHRAIEEKKQISFVYYTEDKEQVDCFNPVKIYENMEDKLLYCLGFDKNMEPSLKRLDKIAHLKVCDSEAVVPDDREFSEKMEYTWGGDLPEGDIYHVKIKIFKETANILDKIKAETRNRKNAKIYDDKDDATLAYYEDDICGASAFKKWLRKYGASVVVLEPAWLAEEMLESAKRRLKVYEEIIGHI